MPRNKIKQDFHFTTLDNKVNKLVIDSTITKSWHIQFDVNIRLYEYWHEQLKIRKKRWNNKEIKKFDWK
jgi:hypothetical protein